MSRRWVVLFLGLVAALWAGPEARAHVGSPDVFFEGKVGPYPARITIRMPAVVPGRAQIDIRPATEKRLEITVLPLFSKTAIENNPPPEATVPVPDDPGVHRGELWLMRQGGYSVAVSIRGEEGDGTVQIPVHSVAVQQLPLPRALASALIGLAGVLAVGGLAIVRAAAGESTLPPGAPMDAAHRRKGTVAILITAVVVTGALVGGWHWWSAEEAAFRRDLRSGLGPDLNAEVHAEGSTRLLRLTLGDKTYAGQSRLPLLPDHGKLLHVFLIGDRAQGSVAHLHPTQRGGKVFEVALPPLPAGQYRIFADLTLANSAAGMTSTGRIQLPAAQPGAPARDVPQADADDSWAICPEALVPKASDPAPVYRFDDGVQLRWKARPPVKVRRDASLEFEARDAAGQPVPLEPYMGMQSHAAVMKADGSVFAHLHPVGNFSMAAQSYFVSKVERAAGGSGELDHSKMHHGDAGEETSSFYLPYEFPSPGDYRLWVQIKTGGQVRTACFEVAVAP